MLKGTFFKINGLTRLENDPGPNIDSELYQADITLNPGHEIYQGHFPGNPVVPGACQIRMITEIVSEIMEKEVVMREADNVKFLSMINPHEHPELSVEINLRQESPEVIKVSTSILDGETVFLKCKAVYSTNDQSTNK